MPKSQKPIICICGSRNITDVNLSLYINPSHVGCVVTGGARGIDTLAEN
jgi:predicted Rossmann fold nucleotide-binding protein DprA/Smf involved in DNA uptake